VIIADISENTQCIPVRHKSVSRVLAARDRKHVGRKCELLWPITTATGTMVAPGWTVLLAALQGKQFLWGGSPQISFISLLALHVCGHLSTSSCQAVVMKQLRETDAGLWTGKPGAPSATMSNSVWFFKLNITGGGLPRAKKTY
jgi:hypothetical protein